NLVVMPDASSDAAAADAARDAGATDSGSDAMTPNTCMQVGGQFCSLVVPANSVTGTGTCAAGVCYRCDGQSELRLDLCIPKPTAHWPFDDGAGTVARDTSGNGNDGRISGATFTAGKLAGALSFDGMDDVVETNPTLLAGLTALTITLW